MNTRYNALLLAEADDAATPGNQPSTGGSPPATPPPAPAPQPPPHHGGQQQQPREPRQERPRDEPPQGAPSITFSSDQFQQMMRELRAPQAPAMAPPPSPALALAPQALQPAARTEDPASGEENPNQRRRRREERQGGGGSKTATIAMMFVIAVLLIAVIYMIGERSGSDSRPSGVASGSPAVTSLPAPGPSAPSAGDPVPPASAPATGYNANGGITFKPAPPDRRNVNTDGRTADGTSVGYAEDAALVWPRPPIYVGDMDWKAAQAEIIRRAQAETSTQGGTVADLAKKRQGHDLSQFRVLGGPEWPALNSQGGKPMYVLATPRLHDVNPRPPGASNPALGRR